MDVPELMSRRLPTVCWDVHLDRMDYGEAAVLQRELVTRRQLGEVPDLLLLLEHSHVYTLGRGARNTDLLLSERELSESGVTVYRADRGGLATYHGPGQLVAYGIVNIRHVRGPASYVHGLEQVVLETLFEFGISGERFDDMPGVWVGGAKIASIGVRVREGITSHGLALNLAPDLRYFSGIVPCGVMDLPVTSMQRVMGSVPNMWRMKEIMSFHWGRVFGYKMKRIMPDAIVRSRNLVEAKPIFDASCLDRGTRAVHK